MQCDATPPTNPPNDYGVVLVVQVAVLASLPLLLLYALLCCALQGAGWPLARGAQSGSMTDWTPHFKGPAGRLARGGSDPQSEGIVVAS